MASCRRCGKKGLFLKVDANGCCPSCAEAFAKEQSNKKDRPLVKPARMTLFDISFPGETLRYKYTDIKLECPVIYSSDILNVGAICGFFRIEEGNDTVEVSITHGADNLPIGFFPDGKLRDMARDWFDRSWTSGGQVSDIRDGNIYINAAFWTPDDAR